MTQHEAGLSDGERMLAPPRARVRRVCRLMTGSHDATPAVLAAVAHDLGKLEEPPRTEREAERAVWHLVAQHLLVARSLSAGEVGPRSPDDSPAQRLAPVVAALPSQLRLALALTHQGRLGRDDLAAAMQVAPVVAEGLLTSAEERLVALARGLGDVIEAPTRPRADPR